MKKITTQRYTNRQITIPVSQEMWEDLWQIRLLTNKSIANLAREGFQKIIDNHKSILNKKEK